MNDYIVGNNVGIIKTLHQITDKQKQNCLYIKELKYSEIIYM